MITSFAVPTATYYYLNGLHTPSIFSKLYTAIRYSSVVILQVLEAPLIGTFFIQLSTR